MLNVKSFTHSIVISILFLTLHFCICKGVLFTFFALGPIGDPFQHTLLLEKSLGLIYSPSLTSVLRLVRHARDIFLLCTTLFFWKMAEKRFEGKSPP